MQGYRTFCKGFSVVEELPLNLKPTVNEGSHSISHEDLQGYQYALLYYTDRVEVKAVPKNGSFDIEKIEKLTELRIFGEGGELYLIRTQDGWKGRVRTDKKPTEKVDSNEVNCEFFDELHKVWEKVKVCGHSSKKLFIRVRNYFNPKGELEFVDSRFVGFEDCEESKCEEAKQ
ncbi:MAG: CRISPR-associated protein Csx19 [Filifactor alocis]|nr:CRISPR-associated protein Csx19 [Filifactor alocis]